MRQQPQEITFKSKLYSEFVAELEQETRSLLLSQLWEKLQKSDAKYSRFALWFCFIAKNTHWLLIIWPMPRESFDVLVYLLAVLSDGEKLQNVCRALLEPCVHGVLKDPVWEILSLSLMLISPNI